MWCHRLPPLTLRYPVSFKYILFHLSEVKVGELSIGQEAITVGIGLRILSKYLSQLCRLFLFRSCDFLEMDSRQARGLKSEPVAVPGEVSLLIVCEVGNPFGAEFGDERY